MSDPTEVRINLNARVTVRLTPKGREMVAAYYRDLLPDLPHLWPEVPAAGEPYSDQLWSIANILGPGMRPGAHPMIEGLTFTAPVGGGVEVVRGEPAPDAPGLDLAPILARADAATPGPWEADLDMFGHDNAAEIEACVSAHNSETLMLFTSGTGLIHHGTDAERDAAWNLAMSGQQARDATFIAHARTDIPALVAEVTRLRAALAHAITTGCAAVADALREGEEARADLATARSRLAHVVAALRVAPALDVPGDPTAARLCAHIEADRRDLARAGDEMLRLTRERDEARGERDDVMREVSALRCGITEPLGMGWYRVPQPGGRFVLVCPDDAVIIATVSELVTTRSRLATLESAPTFADGVRAALAAALAAVSTCCEAAYADIERIDPSTVKP